MQISFNWNPKKFIFSKTYRFISTFFAGFSLVDFIVQTFINAPVYKIEWTFFLFAIWSYDAAMAYRYRNVDVDSIF